MFKNKSFLLSLKISFAVLSPLFFSFFISIIDFFFNSPLVTYNYFSTDFIQKYNANNSRQYLISLFYFLISLIVLFVLFSLVTYKFDIIYDLKSININRNFKNILCIIIIILKFILIFDTCAQFSFIKKFTLLEILFLYIFLISLFEFNIRSLYSLNTIFVILFIGFGFIEAFFGSIYELSYTLLFITIFFFFKYNFFKFLINLFYILLILASFYYLREVSRYSGFVESGKSICSIENNQLNTNFSYDFFKNINCDGLSSFCKKFVSDKLKELDLMFSQYDQTRNSFIKKRQINIDNSLFIDNFLSRYNFTKQLNNYVIPFEENNIFFHKGETYKLLYTKYIPRFLYAAKPTENLGSTIPKNYGLLPLWADHSMPLNVYAESYINFGYLGLVLFPFIIILLLIPYFIILNLLKLNSMLNILVLAHFIFNFQSNLSLSFGYMYITLMLIVMIQFFSKEKSNAKKNYI